MADQSIKALNFQIDEVGKHISASKKRYTWTLSLKAKTHVISLDYSFISGKVKVVVDRKTLLENQLPPEISFQYLFTLDGFSLNCIQQGQTFQLRVNNKAFSHLYNQEKTKSQFKDYEDQIRDIKIDNQKLHGAKSVKLNIGAFASKKKTVKAEDQGWNSFGGQDQFPNYFQPQQNQQFKISKPQTKNQSIIDFEVTNEPQVNKSQLLSPNLIEDSHTISTIKTHNAEILGLQQIDLTNFHISDQHKNANNSITVHNGLDLFEVADSKVQTNQTNNLKQSNFNTMQQLFATNVQQPTMHQHYPNQQFTNIQPPIIYDLQPDFGTNLFASNKLNNFQQPQLQPFQQPQQQPFQQPQQQPFQQPQQSNILDINDFTTMQNLFKTQVPPTPVLNVNVNQTHKIDPNESSDLFKSMGINIQPKKPPTTNQFATGNMNINLNNPHNFGTMSPNMNLNSQPLNFKKQPNPNLDFL